MGRNQGKIKVIFCILILFIIALSIISITFLLHPIQLSRKPQSIAVIEIYGEITSIEKRDYILDMIHYSQTNDTIKGVVLKIDCPGGNADAIQNIYLTLLDLEKEKPLIASIVGLGLSGGYHIAVAGDSIYVLPAAMVGNIGVIAMLPEQISPGENVMETGPYKMRGISDKELPFQVQTILDSFLDSVERGRGDKLSLKRTDLSKGLVYMGSEAVENGLADFLGTELGAIKKAASLAQIEKYSTITVNDVVGNVTVPYSTQGKSRILDIADLRGLLPPPAFYYIYVYPQDTQNDTVSTSWNDLQDYSIMGDNKTILIDYAHENIFAYWELNLFQYEIVSRGYSIRYLNSTMYLDEMLKGSNAFIVINPQTFYSEIEVNSIKEYVQDGGKLILISDPTRTLPSPINSLSSEFGVMFAIGYLYNLGENYGNYRNIYLKDFANSIITKDLSQLVLYTATYIHPTGGEMAYTSASTTSSESVISKKYSPIVFLNEERVVALGDQTFLKEPYCYDFDNYKLLQNIADYITDS